MVVEKVDSLERVADWTYVPPVKYKDRIAVFEISKEKNEWELVFNDTLYKGNFDEIITQCVEIVKSYKT